MENENGLEYEFAFFKKAVGMYIRELSYSALISGAVSVVIALIILIITSGYTDLIILKRMIIAWEINALIISFCRFLPEYIEFVEQEDVDD